MAVREIGIGKGGWSGYIQHDGEYCDLLAALVGFWYSDKFSNHGCFNYQGDKNSGESDDKSLNIVSWQFL